MDQEAQPGQLIAGRYRLVGLLGAGGFGRVWKALDQALDAEVALKEIWLPPVSGAERSTRLARAEREVRHVADLGEHPNIVTVFGAVIDRGTPWIVMRLVRGRSLAQRLDEGALPTDQAARVAESLLRALAAAHAAGIVHRDVKPANVMLAEDGGVLLADFGIAVKASDTALTAPGSFMGSAEYTAPERAMGQDASPASDLFSLGVTLYQATENRSPFRRDLQAGSLLAVVNDQAPPPVAAGLLAPVITGLLEKDPGRRLTVDGALALLGAAPFVPDGATAPLVKPKVILTPDLAEAPSVGRRIRRPGRRGSVITGSVLAASMFAAGLFLTRAVGAGHRHVADPPTTPGSSSTFHSDSRRSPNPSPVATTSGAGTAAIPLGAPGQAIASTAPAGPSQSSATASVEAAGPGILITRAAVRTVTATRQSDGTQAVFAIRADDGEVMRITGQAPDGRYTSCGPQCYWFDMGLQATSLSVALQAGGTVALFATRSSDGGVMVIRQQTPDGMYDQCDTTGCAWEFMSLKATSVTAVPEADGLVQVFAARTGDHQVEYIHQIAPNDGYVNCGVLCHWSDLNMQALSLTAFVHAGGEVQVLAVRASDGKTYLTDQDTPNGAYHQCQTACFWYDLTMQATSVAVAPQADGRSQIFVTRAADHEVWYLFQVAANNGYNHCGTVCAWQDMGFRAGSLSAVLQATGTVALFATRFPDGEIMRLPQQGPNSAYCANACVWSDAGTSATTIAAVQQPDGRVQVFAG